MSRLLCAAAVAAALLAPAALADPGPSHGGGYAHSYGHGYGYSTGHYGRYGHGPAVFRGRMYGRLTPYELGVWRGGHWWHGAHGGRIGWWWFVDGGWYWYDNPIYPYPTAISDTVMMDAPPGVAPGGYNWWYCDNPAGYWPYVRACGSPWQPVAPEPPPQ